MAGQTVKVVVKTTVGTAKKDVEEAVEQALRVQYKEMMGPLGLPVAAKVAEIMGRKAEEVVQPEITKRTLVVGDHNVLKTYPEFDAVKNYLREEMKPRGKEIFFYEFTAGVFDPARLIDTYEAQLEGRGKTLDESTKFDRIVLIVHGGAEPIYDEKGDVMNFDPALAGYRAEVPTGNEPYYPDVTPEELFAQVERVLKPGGELWVFSCEQRRLEWEGKRRRREEAGGGREGNFTLTVIPGTGATCKLLREAPEYIRKAIED